MTPSIMKGAFIVTLIAIVIFAIQQYRINSLKKQLQSDKKNDKMVMPKTITLAKTA